MRARTLVTLFFFSTSLVLHPHAASAATIWTSTPTHADNVLVYTPSLANEWYDGTATTPSVQMGVWDKQNFTTDASTTMHLWSQWNGSYLNILDVVLKAASGGDPFYGSGSTTADVVTPLDDSYYRLNVLATSSLQEYVIPARESVTISQGDQMWAFLYPSYATYGANHWVGSNGSLPYFEICEGSCGSADLPPTLTLLGATTTSLELRSIFTDSGATAQDAIDGDITNTIQITGSVDTSVVGTTTLTYSVTNSHGLTASVERTIVVVDSCATPGACASNVLFLPGIEGSRLYEGTGCGKTEEERLWEPVDSGWSGMWNTAWGIGDGKVHDLSLNEDGSSTCADIYTKEGDVIDSVGGSNIYKSLLDEMNGLKTDSTINDWEPVAYDWRLSLDDLLTKGTECDGKIYYEEATSTPYIEQTLRALAASSKTGKVTIVAHSNGGLVTKALLNKLGDTEAAKLVDKVIMVGVPQSGAPADIGSLLVGYGAGIYKYGVRVVSDTAARIFSQNSPMAYHLLPSASYLASIIDEPTHPVVHFSGDAYTKEETAYGNSIVDLPTLDDFLIAKNGEREKPAANDLTSAEVLSSSLIDYANREHSALDGWSPPVGIEVDQVAGWGVDTVGGVDFYTLPAGSVLGPRGPVREYRPIFIEDGDGTVPVPSALMMATSSSEKDYWVNLHSYNKDTSSGRSHADLFEIPSLQNFIKDILQNNVGALPTYISSVQPTSTSNKKLVFYLHSPLTLQLQDSLGNVTGLAEDGSVTQDIPGSTYGEFGEVKYVTVPEGSQYQLTLHGQASGTFSLDMQETSGGVVTASSTIAGVPTTEKTLVSLSLSGGIDTASSLSVDENGDGKDMITVVPKSGETVVYTPPAPQPTPSAGSGAGHVTEKALAIDSPVITPAPEVAPITTTATPAVATNNVFATTIKMSQTLPIFQPALKKVVTATSPIKTVINTIPKLTDGTPPKQASQQPLFEMLSEAVYNGLYRLWTALKNLF